MSFKKLLLQCSLLVFPCLLGASQIRHVADSLRQLINQKDFPANKDLLDAYFGMDDIFHFPEDEWRWTEQASTYYAQLEQKSIEQYEQWMQYRKLQCYLLVRQSAYDRMMPRAYDLIQDIDELGEVSPLLRGIKAKAQLYISQVYFAKEQFEKSNLAVQQALNEYLILKDTYNIAQCLKAMAIRNDALGSDEAVDSLINEAGDLFLAIDNETEWLRTQNLIGALALEKQQWERTASILAEIKPIMQDRKHPSTLYTISDLGLAQLKLGDLDAARQTLEEGLSLTEDARSIEMLIVYYETMVELEEQSGNFQEALRWQKDMIILQDTLDNRLNDPALLNTDVRIQMEDKLRELEEISLAETRRYRYLLWIGLPLVILLTGVIVWWLGRSKQQKLKKQIHDLMDREPAPRSEVNIQWNDPAAKVTNTNDEIVQDHFLELFVSKVQSRLSDPDLTVESLAASMKISRVQLFKRVKSATGGNAPSTLIRAIRLEKAHRLLSEQNMGILEVSEEVGFTSQSSFTRAFKAHFGYTPSKIPA